MPQIVSHLLPAVQRNFVTGAVLANDHDHVWKPADRSDRVVSVAQSTFGPKWVTFRNRDGLLIGKVPAGSLVTVEREEQTDQEYADDIRKTLRELADKKIDGLLASEAPSLDDPGHPEGAARAALEYLARREIGLYLRSVRNMALEQQRCAVEDASLYAIVFMARAVQRVALGGSDRWTDSGPMNGSTDRVQSVMHEFIVGTRRQVFVEFTWGLDVSAAFLALMDEWKPEV